MENRGHVHAESMALYAEDAKVHEKPWELWQVRHKAHAWYNLVDSPTWITSLEYRRKPKTHFVHGVEIPDLRFKPIIGQRYWYPHASMEYLVSSSIRKHGSTADKHRIENNLCYKHSYEGKQAAILHAKAMLGIVKELQELKAATKQPNRHRPSNGATPLKKETNMACIISNQIDQHTARMDELDRYDEWLADYQPTASDYYEVLDGLVTDDELEVILDAVRFILANDLQAGELAGVKDLMTKTPQQSLFYLAEYIDMMDVMELAETIERSYEVATTSNHLMKGFESAADEYLKNSDEIYKKYQKEIANEY